MLRHLTNFLLTGLLVCLTVWAFTFEAAATIKPATGPTLYLPNGAGLGQGLRVPAQPKRAIFLNSSSFDMWMRLGGAGQVAGVPLFSSVDKALYKQLPAGAQILPNYSSMSVEKIVYLKPDLIVMNGVDGAKNNLAEAMSRQAIPFMNMPGDSIADTFAEMRAMSRLTGQGALAEQEINRIQQALASCQDKYAGKPRKKVMMVLGISTSFFMVTPHARQSEILQLAGGDNIVKAEDSLGSRYISMSLEYAARENPDYVFFINHGPRKKMEVKVREALSESSAWNAIRAVREGRVYVLPPELFSINPGIQTDKAVELLCEIIYEEKTNGKR